MPVEECRQLFGFVEAVDGDQAGEEAEVELTVASVRRRVDAAELQTRRLDRPGKLQRRIQSLAHPLARDAAVNNDENGDLLIAATLVFVEMSHCFHMMGLRKHIEGGERVKPVATCCQSFEIAGKCCRVAGDV